MVTYNTTLLTSDCEVNSCISIYIDQDFGDICFIDTPSDCQERKPKFGLLKF